MEVALEDQVPLAVPKNPGSCHRKGTNGGMEASLLSTSRNPEVSGDLAPVASHPQRRSSHRMI